MNAGFLLSQPGEEPVIVEALFSAPVDRVYRAWTDPGEIVKWFGAKAGELLGAEIDLRVGGRWRFILSDNQAREACLEGEYTTIEPQRRLEFSWRHVRVDGRGVREETPASTVRVVFLSEGAATRVRLRHEGIVREPARRGVGGGWDTAFDRLEDLFGAE